MSSSVNRNRGRDQFVGNGGPITVNNNIPSESGLEKLAAHVSANALHSAKSRANRRECLQGTRGGFIETLGKWIENPEEKGRVKWVCAGAGVGKTAVAQTLCDKYFETRLAASHFFSRNDTSRNGLHSFVPTIAYQLAKSPALEPHLADAIDVAARLHLDIVGADWEDRFKRLITEPCSRINPEAWETLPKLIIIDGLDECMDTHEQQARKEDQDVWKREGQARLLSLIEASTTGPSPLPFRFLIFSRPEHTISNFFRTVTIPEFEQLDMHELRSEADADIELYLRHEFSRFQKLHPDAGLPESWPGEDVIEELVRKSDGHFIYVVTLIRFLMEDDSSLSLPQERLDIVLHPRRSAHPNLTPIDQLYHQILDPLRSIRKQVLLPALQLTLGSMVGTFPLELVAPFPRLPTVGRQVIAQLLNLDPRRLSVTFSRLRSVLYVPDDELSEISVLHASFSDFLTDKRRSHDFHVSRLTRERRHLMFTRAFPPDKRFIRRDRNLHNWILCIGSTILVRYSKDHSPRFGMYFYPPKLNSRKILSSMGSTLM
ncbi:hypothetical protein V5O48_014106 [Marasmius crinis-equi]|uniref:Nephrocystin 3-like N-terminal domain-containing protein n=1 Tax=Marasmius crinis-equi TaxID=585013 RepID=A0ABR3EY90_9AGAR